MTEKLLTMVVLISGSGSNLQAMIDAITNQKLHAKILAVISHREHVFGLERAKSAAIPTHILLPKDFPDRHHYDHALHEIISQYQPDLVVLAGFLRILGEDFVNRYYGQLINIHPSLLPKHLGLHTHQKALEVGDKEHGCTIHFVIPALDEGPIIAQARLEIRSGDTIETLGHRVHGLEHKLYPTVLEWFAQKRIALTPDGVKLDNKILPATGKQFTEENFK